MNVRNIFLVSSALILSLIILVSLFWSSILWSLIFVVPLVVIGLYDMLQTKHSILRNYPLIGHGRFLLESVRPEIMQYFVETDTEGRPFNRLFRSLIYQRSKGETDTTPFGTQMYVYRSGYEWMDHSMYAKNIENLELNPRVVFGGTDCKQPYSASILNISAMSFGSLSKNAVMALNKGAKLNGFAHNTGEGGLSPYHLEYGGDLIWQIGTGYFGCRDKDGNFSPELFKEQSARKEVKMIEIKISQGAKPGHGGILPAGKNTEEIASIRKVKPGTTVHSPPTHSTFSDAKGLMNFIQQLRDLSAGKPIGFKLCLGRKSEFIDLCKMMVETNIKPDFITIDGGEGGTGAAPVEFSNSLGMPLRDALLFAYDTLNGFDLKKEIKLIASGKIVTGFHIARAISLGADTVNSARAMMMSVGCIQALQCNTNECPVGVATQRPDLVKGLDVEDKSKRTASYHKETIHSFVELIAAAGISKPSEITRRLINRRVSMNNVMKFSELYPGIKTGLLLNNSTVPLKYKEYFGE
ncbi:MAG: FMN-binding glutamate synthase family protein [Ignavibacteriae bacterium]|nr:FMN-binding glutamate synthase family protein [Ignavibacteriota bacterium]